ncbi:phosphotransferase [Luedemannella flava]
MGERQRVTRADVAGLVGDVCGRGVADLERLSGGSKKGVYRVRLDDGDTVVLYVWADDENYWPAMPPGEPATPLGDASGLDQFEAATAELRAVGARTPEVLFSQRAHGELGADVALVADLPGGTLERLIDRDPGAAAKALAELGEMLTAMAKRRNPRLGKVIDPTDARDAVDVVRDRALRHLAAAANRVPALAAARERIEQHLLSLAAGLAPRTDYGLIHGELGPDHVLIDRAGRPVLVDIEGLLFFDVEWEHAFTRMRFGDAYPPCGCRAWTGTGCGSTRSRSRCRWSRGRSGSPAGTSPIANS